MAREGNFFRRCEDAHRARMAIIGRKDKGALREVKLPRNLLHLVTREAVCIRQHSQLISSKATFGEDVAQVVAISHRSYFKPRSINSTNLSLNLANLADLRRLLPTATSPLPLGYSPPSGSDVALMACSTIRAASSCVASSRAALAALSFEVSWVPNASR